MKRFNGICLVSENVPAITEFYRHVLDAEIKGSDTFARVVTDGAVLSVFSEEGMEKMAPGSMKQYGHGGFTLEFEVEDVDKEYERLCALNVAFVKPPTTQSWRRRSVGFRDPDNNIINFYTPVNTNASDPT